MVIAGLSVSLFAIPGFWIFGGRAVIVCIAIFGTIATPVAMSVAWRDYKSGGVRFGRKLQWRATRKHEPIRFWLVIVLTLVAIPILIALIALMWWSVFWGNWT